MAELENTAGEAGVNATQTIDVEGIVKTVLNAVNEKSAKNERSIKNDNFEKLSDEDREKAYALYDEYKNAEAKKAEKAAKAKDDRITELEGIVKGYQTKERNAQFESSISSIFDEVGITEDGARKQALKLATAGVNVDDWFDGDAVNTSKIKETIDAIVADVPSLQTSKKVVKIEKTTEKDENAEAAKVALFKSLGL